MLESTFIFLNGIGPYRERRLWDEQILTWDSFLNVPQLPGISLTRKGQYDSHILEAQQHLSTGQSLFFKQQLRQKDHWRLYDRFGHNALYLDIETTGGSAHTCDLTVVGLYRQGVMTSLVQGKNLTESRVCEEFEQADLLVTFFGSVFDLPFLRAKFPRLPHHLPHFDLCFAARRLGISGGLKHIESELGLLRATDLIGLDGMAAIQLWNKWTQGNSAALETLLRYNEADTRNLEPLAKLIYSRLRDQLGPPTKLSTTLHHTTNDDATS